MRKPLQSLAFLFFCSLFCTFVSHLSAQTSSRDISSGDYHPVVIDDNNPLKNYSRPMLGVEFEQNADGGVRFKRIISTSGAAEAGLAGGDELVSIDGKSINSPCDFVSNISSHKVGDRVRVEVRREGEPLVMNAELRSESDIMQKSVAASSVESPNAVEQTGSISRSAIGILQVIKHRLSDPDEHTDKPCAKLTELTNTAFLGVQINDARIGGAHVIEAIANTGAVEAGLSSGDVLTSIDGKTIDNYQQCAATIRAHKPGDVVTLNFTRGGEIHQVEARLGSIADSKREVVKRLEARCAESAGAQATKGFPTTNESAKRSSNLNTTNADAQPTLVLSPNPAVNTVGIRFESADAAPFTIVISDAAGRKVYEQSIAKLNGVYESSVDLSQVARGLYVVSIRQGSAVHTAKLALE